MPSTNWPSGKLSPLSNKTFRLRAAPRRPQGGCPPAPSMTEAPGTPRWGRTLSGARAAHGAWGSGRRLAAAGSGVPTGTRWQLAFGEAQQETRRRQHGLRGNPQQAPRQSVTQGARQQAALPPLAGAQGPGCRKQRGLSAQTQTQTSLNIINCVTDTI